MLERMKMLRPQAPPLHCQRSVEHRFDGQARLRVRRTLAHFQVQAHERRAAVRKPASASREIDAEN